MKKVISVFLAVLMLVTIIPFSAFAVGEEETQTETQQDVSYNGTNALGDVVADAMNESETQNEEGYGYFIQDVEIDGLEATVILSAPDESTLVVAVYDEDSGIMSTSGKTEVDSTMETATVTLAECEMPEYFTVKAFLLNSENAPVCTSYESIKYTAAFQEFLDKTIYDFDEEKVINLDYGYESNFAVVSDDAEVIEQSEDENILTTNDYENGIYVFENANEEIMSLSVGEVFYFVYDDGADDYILTKIGTIENDNGTVTITAADEFEISDFFSYIKIDSTEAESEKPETYSKARSFNEDSGNEEETKKYEIEPFSIQFDNGDEPEEDSDIIVDADGEVDYDITLSCNAGYVESYVKFYYDIHLFGEDSYQFEYNVKASMSFELKIDAYGTVGVTFYALKDRAIPILPALDITVTIKLSISFTAHVSATGKLGFEVSRGVQRRYDKREGVDYTNQLNPDAEPIIEFSGKANVVFSVKPTIEVGFKIFKVFSAKVGITGSFSISLTMVEVTVNGMDGIEDSVHLCTLCFDTGITINITAFFKISFNITKDPDKEKIIVQINPIDISVPIKEGHLSLADGKWSLEQGKCENYLYKVDFFLFDESNNPIEDVTISVDSTILKTDGSGKANGYYVSGIYEYMVEKKGYSVDASRMDQTGQILIVFDSSETVNIYLKKDNENENDSSESYVVFDTSEENNFTLSGTLKTEDYVINSLNYGTAYILDLDEPFYVKIYDDYFEIDGDVRYIDSVQINDSNAKSMIDKHVTVTGEAILAHTGHHQRTIVLTDCEISELVDDLDNVVEPDFEAFENMLNACFYWETTTVDDFSKLPLNTILENYITNPGVPFGVYAFFSENGIHYAGGINHSFEEYGDPEGLFFASYELDADLTDWILINVFNISPDRQYSGSREYYYGDKLYVAPTDIGGGVEFVYEVRDYELLNNNYYKLFVSYSLDFGDDYHEYVGDLEFEAMPKTQEGFGNYWSIKSCKESEIEIVDSGICGDNVSWTLYNDGKLLISGAGAMTNYSSSSSAPWKPYRESITKVTIGNSVTSIGDYMFSGCSSLTSIIIPNSVISIGDNAFIDCTNLINITIPNSVTSIGDYAFYYCQNLLEVIIPDSITYIGNCAFDGCSSLTNITISDSVTYIGDYAFRGCDNLINITVDDDNKNYSSDKYGVLFNKEKTELIQYPIGNTKTEYIIPDSVTYISDFSFNYCYNLTSIIIPDNIITYIGDWAFSYCYRLESITIPKCVTNIGSYTFYENYNLETVYYSGTETQWSEISIGSYNDSLTNATIIYNYSGIAKARSMSYPTSYNAVAEETAMNADVTSVIVGNEYVMLIVRDINAEDLLAPENLLYIDQKTAESDTLSFNFYLADGESDYVVIFTNAKLNVQEYPALLGDVNMDGKITAADARIILRISAQLDKTENYDLPFEVFDVTGDGKITAADARKVLRISAMIES